MTFDRLPRRASFRVLQNFLGQGIELILIDTLQPVFFYNELILLLMQAGGRAKLFSVLTSAIDNTCVMQVSSFGQTGGGAWREYRNLSPGPDPLYHPLNRSHPHLEHSSATHQGCN